MLGELFIVLWGQSTPRYVYVDTIKFKVVLIAYNILDGYGSPNLANFNLFEYFSITLTKFAWFLVISTPHPLKKISTDISIRLGRYSSWWTTAQSRAALYADK